MIETQDANSRTFRLRTSALISIATFVGAASEFAKNAAIGYRYGSGAATDTFFTAYLVPNTYGMFWISACSVGLVPLFAKWRRDSVGHFHDRATAVVALSVLFTLALTVFSYVLARPMMDFSAPGFPPAQKADAVRLFRELSALFLLVGFSGAVAALMNSRSEFFLPCSNKAIVNSLFVAGLLLAPHNASLLWLSRLQVIGAAAFAAFILARVLRVEQVAWPGFRQSRAVVAAATSAILAPFAALVARQASALAERAIASYLTVGAISSLTYASQLVMGASGIISIGVISQLMPLVAAENDKEKRVALVAKGCYYQTLGLAPFSVIVYCFAEVLVTVLLQRGMFQQEQTIATSQLVRIYSLGVLVSGLAQQFQTIHWADSRYRVLLVHNALVAVVNVLADLALVPFLGVAGLAFGVCFASAFSGLRMYRLVVRDYGPLFCRDTSPAAMGKPVLAGLGMALVILSVRSLMNNVGIPTTGSFGGLILSNALPATVGTLAFVTTAVWMRIEPIRTVAERSYTCFRRCL